MPLQIHNTLTRKKEDFRPLKDKGIGIYACGLTVYDDCHIGHARSLYIFEVIKNFLEFRGFKVKFIRNITDIDDKIINKAKETGKSWKDIATKYIRSYREDLKLLNLSEADVEPLATNHIKPMQKLIATLIKKGFAYEAGGDVYFSVRKFKDYGKLSGQSLEAMQAGSRIEAGENKRDPLDFALWKKSKEAEPSWQSPWGEGRPGWHIECSVMSTKFLGQPFDIHAGGRDLIFPHHENEIAQSEAAKAKTFARYWLHHGLLTIQGQKMAKSLGNFVTVKDFIAKKYHPDVLKLFFLQTHYSQPIDFTWELIEEKRKALYGFINLLKRIKQREEGEDFYIRTKLEETISPQGLKEKVEEARADFKKAMDNDFNTPTAVAALFNIKRACEKILYDVSYTKKYLPVLTYAKKTVKELGNILGMSFQGWPLPMSKEEIEKVIDIRQKLRAQKMFKEADRLRKELEEKGIILEDTKEGGSEWQLKI